MSNTMFDGMFSNGFNIKIFVNKYQQDGIGILYLSENDYESFQKKAISKNCATCTPEQIKCDECTGG